MSVAWAPGSAPHKPAIDRLPRVGALATMPSRLDTAGRAFASLVDQLDRVYVYLDGHERTPDFARHPKVRILKPTRTRSWGVSGRYRGLEREPEPCAYVAFDDDILYPPDYVACLVDGLARRDGRAVVGIHATTFEPPHESFVRDIRVFHFTEGLGADTRVDMIGAGTVAFVSSVLPVDPARWAELDMDDLMIAMEAESRGIPSFALARPPNYLVRLGSNQPDSLWRKVKSDDSRHSRRMRQLLDMQRRRRAQPNRQSTPAPSSAGMALPRNRRNNSRPIPY